MAKTKEIFASYRKKVQIVKYEPVDITMGMTVTLEEGDDEAEEHNRIVEICRDRVFNQLLKDFERHGVNPLDRRIDE